MPDLERLVAGRRKVLARLVALSTILALAVVAPACRRDNSRPPNLLLIVIDTLRADRLGAYGNTLGLTPFLDELALRGTVFENAHATSSWTCPSVASLFTSRYPSQHNVVTFGSRLSDEEVTLAERLQALHYVAAGFSANLRLPQRRGYAQGFQHWQSEAQTASGLKGEDLRRQSLEWLDAAWQRTSPHPALLYFQYMEPHSPYDPPEPFRSRYLRDDVGHAMDVAAEMEMARKVMRERRTIEPRDLIFFERLYNGEVATVDDEVRTLFTELERRGFLENAIIVLTADHGEEFGEHGGLEHGRTLYEESVRVPLILIAPGITGGLRVAERVSLVDLAPTLLELLHLPPEPRFEGRSLLPLIAGESGEARASDLTQDVILQLLPINLGRDRRVHEHGIMRGTLKLLIRPDGQTESYDTSTDPGEETPNPPELQPVANELTATLKRTNRLLLSRAATAVEPETIDEATKEKLRALGYEP